MKKILITGGNGQIAYEFVRSFQAKNITLRSPAHAELDITNADAVMQVIQDYQPDVVINSAAYTRVDLAETESQQAYAVNEQGAKNLAIACAKIKCTLVHISTDYVFSGAHNTPYVETDPAQPISIYGDSKLRGEQAVQEYCDQSIILRVSGVFGVHGLNFVKTILRLAKERESLRVVADQTICPTPAKKIAEVIWQILLNPQWGIYHYCGEQITNWHAFAKVIVQTAKDANIALSVKQIDAITTADYPLPAKRPPYSVLNCEKMYKIFGIIQPDWNQGVADVIAELSH